MDNEKYVPFPVETETSCLYKWTWSTLFLGTGLSSSCHRCKGWDVSETMEDFHNHPGKIADREKMLVGEWPGNGCEYCRSIEDSGGESERTSYINKSQHVPPELEIDATATHVSPRIVEVYFNNVCNHKCVYCGPHFSSLIQAEIEKHGPLANEYDLSGYKQREDYAELKDKFWIWMEKNSKHLYHFQVLGGEPLYQKEFTECLNFFEAGEHPNLIFKIFSNLTHDTAKFKEKIELIASLVERKKIKSFQMVCSMDCWGPQAEYSRYGVKLSNWEDNFNILLNHPQIQVSIHSTITPVTLPTMAEFYKKIIEWEKIKPIKYGWNIVVNPTFMDPCIIGEHATQFFDDIIDIIPEGYSKTYLGGFKQKVVSHSVDPVRLRELARYLDEIDRRRNTDWRSLYPWLVDIINEESKNIKKVLPVIKGNWLVDSNLLSKYER
jgi:organic radical activating enzyme